MRLFFQNPRNPYMDSKNLQITPEHTVGQRILIVFLFLLFFPVMLVVYVVGQILLGSFNLAAQMAFFLTDAICRPIDPEEMEPAYAWQSVRAFIAHTMAARVPHINTSYRKFLYKLNGIRIGRGVFVGQGGILEELHPENFALEDGACMSFGVTVVCHGPKRNLTDEQKTVILRKNAYVGAACVLTPGVEIGENAIVGAGSVVTKNIPAGAVAAGCPCRVLRYQPGYGPEGKTEEVQ